MLRVKKLTCLMLALGAHAVCCMYLPTPPSSARASVQCPRKNRSRSPGPASPPLVVADDNFAELRATLDQENYELALQIVHERHDNGYDHKNNLSAFEWSRQINASSLLRHALLHGDISAVKYLMSQDVRDSFPPINDLIVHGKIKRAQNLARVIQQLESSSPESARRYIEKQHWYGTNVTLNKSEFHTLVQCLARDGHTPAIRWLNAHYPAVQAAIDPATLIAVINKKTDTARYLLTHCTSTTTFLHSAQLAAESGDVETLRHIMEKHNITLNEIPLISRALNNGNAAVVEYLCTRPQAQPHLTTIFRMAINRANDARAALTNTNQARTKSLIQGYDHIVRFLIEEKHGDVGALLTSMLAIDANGVAALDTIKHLIEVQHIAPDIIDQAAEWAIEHGHQNVVSYLFSNQRVRLDHLVITAQQKRLYKTFDYLLTYHASELDMPEVLAQSAESNDAQLYTMALAKVACPQDHIRPLILAIIGGNQASIQAGFSALPPEALPELLHTAATCGLDTTIERIATQCLQSNHADAIHETFMLALDTSHPEVLRALIEHGHCPGNFQELLNKMVYENHIASFTYITQSTLSALPQYDRILQESSMCGSFDIVASLIAQLPKDQSLDRAVQVAQRFGHTRVVAHMVNHYADRLDLDLLKHWATVTQATELVGMINRIIEARFLASAHPAIAPPPQPVEVLPKIPLNEEVCCICLDPLATSHAGPAMPGNHLFVSPPCLKHGFHRDCIALWIKSKPTCPCCRAALLSQENRDLIAAAWAGNDTAIRDALARGALWATNQHEATKCALATHCYDAIMQGITDNPAAFNDFDWKSSPESKNLFSYAANKNNRAITAYLISRGSNGSTPIAQIAALITQKNFQGARARLEHKVLFGRKYLLTPDQFNELMCVAANSESSTVIAWLYENYPPTREFLDQATQTALLCNRLDVAAYLLARHTKREPIAHYAHIAAQLGDVEILNHILTTYQPAINTVSMLEQAIKRGSVPITQYLCTYPETIPYHDTFLHLAIGHATLHRNSTTSAADHVAQDYDAIVDHLITRVIDPRATIQRMITKGADKRAALQAMRHFVEVQHVAPDLVDEAAMLALDNDHTELACYLLNNHHARFEHVILHALAQNRLVPIIHILRHYPAALDTQIVLAYAAELGKTDAYNAIAACSQDLRDKAMHLVLASNNGHEQTAKTITALMDHATIVQALHLAVCADAVRAAHFIVEKNALQLQTEFQDALMHAASAGRIEIVRMFMDHNTPYNRQHLLTCAVMHDNQALVQLIFKAHPPSDQERDALVLQAAELGAITVFQCLVHQSYTGRLDRAVRQAQRAHQSTIVRFILTQRAHLVDLPLLIHWASSIKATLLDELAKKALAAAR